MVPPPIIGGWNADSDSSEDNLEGLRPDQANFPGLVHITATTSGGYMDISPIEEVFAVPPNSYQDVAVQEQRLSRDRYQKLKPLWVKATIRKHHIDRGEETGDCKDLRDVIRARGKRTKENVLTDQCGHIVANTLGGKMIDINLFPQNAALNCGHANTYLLWRSFEYLMKRWVTTIPEKYKPRVLFNMKLFYSDQIYIDRPNKFFYCIEFVKDDDEDSETDEKGEEKSLSISQLLRNCIHEIIECRAMELNTIKTKIKEKIDLLAKKRKKNLNQLMKDLFSDIDEIKAPNPIPVAAPPQPAQWQPSHVYLSEQSPQGRTYFNWNDRGLQEWKENAIKMQDAHVRDNNRTKWFAYKFEDRDALELRILVALYGVRTPTEGSRAAPSCPTKTYLREERLEARKLKKVIIKHCDTPENIHFNVIYISTATKAANDEKFYASEEPVFVINDHRKFIDRNGRVYKNFQDYKAMNTLPKAAMLAPKNGTYTPVETSNGRVALELGETPATGLLPRIKAVADTVVMIGGIALGITGVVTYFAPALFSATAASVIQSGSFFIMTYSLVGAGYGIYDKTAHDEGISTEVFILISAALSTYSGTLRMQAIKYARDGKTYAEVMEKIGKVRSAIFAIANTLTIFSSSSAFISGIFNLLAKRERTWLDYYQLCMSAFLLCNVLTKPMTIKSVFESEQIQYLKQIKSSLKSEEAKEEMTKMVEEHETSEQKAYLIRNLNKIENPTEFFELIKKTGSVVTCTADGLVLNGNIDISPETYNDIGKTAFIEQFNKIEKVQDAAFRESVTEEFEKYIPEENQKEFQDGVEEIKNLPVEKQREAMKNLVSKLGSQGGPSEEEFHSSWKNSQTVYENTMNEKIDEVMDRFQEGSAEPGQKKDFAQLRDLAKKRIHGTMTNEEREQFKENFDKCSNHRKEQFFQSSANHRDDVNNPTNNETFKKDIQTFTNVQNEQLCYRINVEDVKKNLCDVFGVANHEDITINGVKVFENMKPSDYHRLNRLLQDNGPNGPRIIATIKGMVTDPNFDGKVRTTNDIFAMAEDIKNKMNALPEGQRQAYLDNLSNGTNSTQNSNKNTEVTNASRSEPVNPGLPGASDNSPSEPLNPGLPVAFDDSPSEPINPGLPDAEKTYTVRMDYNETENSTEPNTKSFGVRGFVGLWCRLSAIFSFDTTSGIKPYES